MTFAAGSACLRIGQAAFLQAEALTAVVLPAAVGVIGNNAFSGTGLTSFSLLDTQGEWQAAVNEEATSGTPVAFTENAAENARLVNELDIYCFLKK